LHGIDGAAEISAEAPARLPVVATFRAALATYRAEPGHVVGAAFAVLVPVTLLQAVLLHLGDHATDAGTLTTVGFLSLGATGVSSLATVFYGGVLDLLVHAREHGEPPPTFADARRRLPLGRLFGASWAYFAVVMAGLVLLVLPGFVAIVLLSLVGPLIVMEDLRVGAAFRRSAALTRRHFLRCVVLLLVPVLVEVEAAGLASVLPGGPSLAGELLVEGLVTGLIASYVGLVEVHTARTLVAMDLISRRPAA
jgi:hypothetical protein